MAINIYSQKFKSLMLSLIYDVEKARNIDIWN
jgi:hypothetical protein